MPHGEYPCPCCGWLVFKSIGLYEDCPICGWEDDVFQLRFAAESGANRLSLFEAQRNVLATGMSSPGKRKRQPRADDIRDPQWRPVEQGDIEVNEEGVDYGWSYPPSKTDLYYWRATYFRRDLI